MLHQNCVDAIASAELANAFYFLLAFALKADVFASRTFSVLSSLALLDSCYVASVDFMDFPHFARCFVFHL